jgi:thiol-disulfide isomerase/thioredoxin
MSRFLFARIGLIPACFAVPAKAPAALTAASSRKTAPDFTLNDVKGNPVKLSAYKGKVVLLDFWGTFCGVCKVEVPWYEGALR